MQEFKLSEKGKLALSKQSQYKEWVAEDAHFFFVDPTSIWCDIVRSGVDGRVLDTNVHKSVDSYLVPV